MMRMNIDDGDIFLGEFANGALVLGADQLRHRRQLPGHRSARLRQQRRAHLPPRRGGRHLRNAARGHARSGRVPRAGDPGALLSARRQPPRIVADALLREPDQQLHRRDPERRRRERRRLRRRRVGPGSDQRGRAVVPRAAVGVVAAPGHDKAAWTHARRRRFFESYYRLRPVNATFTGIHEHDHRLPDWSPDGLAAAVDEMQRAARRRSRRRDPPAASLHDVAERDRELAISFLDIQIAEHESPPLSARQSVARARRGDLRRHRADDAPLRAGRASARRRRSHA